MYFAIIGFISFFVFLEMFNKFIIEKYKYVFAFTCFALLVFQDGFRWETGTDWDPYTISLKNSPYQSSQKIRNLT